MSLARHLAISLPTLGAALAFVGCGSPAASADGAALFSCADETRAVAYAPNLTRTSDSGAFQAVLLEGVPAPPARGTNTWTLKIIDAEGVAQDGLAMTVAPYMPDHRHPSTIKAAVTPIGGGEYSMAPLYFFMPGYWEIRLTVQPAGGAVDKIVFPICIPG
jgi:YtkA-like